MGDMPRVSRKSAERTTTKSRRSHHAATRDTLPAGSQQTSASSSVRNLSCPQDQNRFVSGLGVAKPDSLPAGAQAPELVDADADEACQSGARVPAGITRRRVLISCCKGETHTHRDEFRHLARRLHAGGWAPEKFNPKLQSVTAGPISSSSLAGADLVIFGSPTIEFTRYEMTALHDFVYKGGSMLVCGGDSGALDNPSPQQSSSNLTELLSPYGVAVQNDALISLVQQENLKPREVLVQDGPLCSALPVMTSNKVTDRNTSATEVQSGPGMVFANSCSLILTAAPAALFNHVQRESHDANAILQLQHSLANFVIGPPTCAKDSDASRLPMQLADNTCSGSLLQPVRGSDVSTAEQMPSGEAVPLASSGPMCNPPLRTLAASWRGRDQSAGRVVVLGSADVLSGEWLRRQENSRACDALLQWLHPDQADESLELPAITRLVSPKARRNIIQQASHPRVCLQVEDALPGDWTKLFIDELVTV